MISFAIFLLFFFFFLQFINLSGVALFPTVSVCGTHTVIEQGHFHNKGIKRRKQGNIKVNLLFSGSPVSAAGGMHLYLSSSSGLF